MSDPESVTVMTAGDEPLPQPARVPSVSSVQQTEAISSAFEGYIPNLDAHAEEPAGEADGLVDGESTGAARVSAPKPAKKNKARPQPPRHNECAVSYRYRFAFEKIGPLALLGHLDLIRALPRVFRRIGVTMAYTEGFHPKPDMVFAPALSLGVPSLDEYVDIKLQDKLDPSELLERMNETAPEGLHFTAAAALGPMDPGVNKVIGEGHYSLIFAKRALPSGVDGLAEAIARVQAATELPIVRNIEGIKKKLDVKMFLRSLELDTEASRDAATRAGLIGDLITVEIHVAITGNGSVKSSEVAEVLLGAQVPHRAVRMALMTDSGMSPIEYIGKAPIKVHSPRPASPALTSDVPVSA